MDGLTTLIVGAGHVGTFAGWALDAEGLRVVAADREPAAGFFGRFGPTTTVPLLESDITDGRALDALMTDLKPDVVVLTAGMVGAECSRDPAGAWQVNVEGARRVGAAALSAGARGFVYLSSLAVYGRPRVEGVSEDAPLRPASVYGQTKVAAEEVLLRLREQGLAVVVLRPCGTFGPVRLGRGSQSARLIERALLLALRGRTIDVSLTAGTGDELLYVKDLGRAIALVVRHIEDGPPPILNVGSGHRTTKDELRTALLGIATPEAKITFADADDSDHPAMPALDVRRLHEWAGFEQAFDLRSAFQDYVDIAGLQ